MTEVKLSFSSNLPTMAGCSGFLRYSASVNLCFVRVKPANHGRFRYYNIFV